MRLYCTKISNYFIRHDLKFRMFTQCSTLGNRTYMEFFNVCSYVTFSLYNTVVFGVKVVWLMWYNLHWFFDNWNIVLKIRKKINAQNDKQSKQGLQPFLFQKDNLNSFLYKITYFCYFWLIRYGNISFSVCSLRFDFGNYCEYGELYQTLRLVHRL